MYVHTRSIYTPKSLAPFSMYFGFLLGSYLWGLSNPFRHPSSVRLFAGTC